MEFYVDSIMGDKVGRSTVFGLPLQQQWSYRVTGENAPTYYLDTDAPSLLLLFLRCIYCNGRINLCRKKSRSDLIR